MKKLGIISIIIVSIISFSLLVYHGFTRTRGMPVPIEKSKRIVLEILYIVKEIDLDNGIDKEFWAGLPSQEIKLLYQVMVLPWPKIVTPLVTVKAFHNKKDIYFYMSWKDETENRTIGINKFSDACAIMFPLNKKVDPPTLMMGFLGKANIWHWKASRDKEYWDKEKEEDRAYADFHYPFEDKETLVVSKDVVKSAVNDLISIRVTTVTPKETQEVKGRGIWSEGAWQAVFKRSMNATDPEVDALFEAGKMLCAFAVWNGEKGDRGGRKSISDWVELEVK